MVVTQISNMGGSNSTTKKLFTILDRDNTGVLTLDNILYVQKLPDMGLNNWYTSHSPLLLFRFDASQEGSINYQEFQNLLKHLQEAEKKAEDIKKSRELLDEIRNRNESAWTSVDEASKSDIDLDRESETPMIVGAKHPEEAHMEQEVLTAEEEERVLRELVQQEAREFFSKLIKGEEGRQRFISWLFQLADYDHNNEVSADELKLVLEALAKDGIMPENLSFTSQSNPSSETNDSKKSDAVQKILKEYDTGQSGFLTRDEFFVLADLILRNYELRCDYGENYVGKYKLKRKIGEGASGVVWLAFNTETKAYKAIKAMKKGDVSDMSRVDVEIKAMLMLAHPNIVRLVEVLETDTHVYFVMELCGGGPLSEHVQQGQPLSEEVSLFYFLQLNKAIKYCHSMGVCHRDLKLENLLLDNSGDLKITDFGHAGIFPKGWDIFSTGMIGSLWHLSPEQLAGQCYSGEKIDIWAMGVILYRLVVGQPPFFTTNPNEFCQKIQTADFELPDFLSAHVKDLISKILKVDPEERLSLDQILEHPWCKGTATQPNLVSQKLSVNSSVDNELHWNLLKDVCQDLDIHVLEAPHDEHPDKRILKCTYLPKDLKFVASLSKHGEEPNFLEFNLKEGESREFRICVDRIKTKFRDSLPEVLQKHKLDLRANLKAYYSSSRSSSYAQLEVSPSPRKSTASPGFSRTSHEKSNSFRLSFEKNFFGSSNDNS